MKVQPIVIFTCLRPLHIATCAAYIATLMLTADIFSRVIRFPDVSPITSVIGALFFLALALRQMRRQS